MWRAIRACNGWGLAEAKRSLAPILNYDPRHVSGIAAA
jgi:hypothetical protein